MDDTDTDMSRQYDWERESPYNAVDAAFRRRFQGARYGLRVSVIHGVGGVRPCLLWFDELEELVKFFDLYLPAAKAYPEPLPRPARHANWSIPFDVPDLQATEVGPWLMGALEGIEWSDLGRDLHWAGPIEDLLHSPNPFCVRARVRFLSDWEDKHPPTIFARVMRRLRRPRPAATDAEVPESLEDAFFEWMGTTIHHG